MSLPGHSKTQANVARHEWRDQRRAIKSHDALVPGTLDVDQSKGGSCTYTQQMQQMQACQTPTHSLFIEAWSRAVLREGPDRP